MGLMMCGVFWCIRTRSASDFVCCLCFMGYMYVGLKSECGRFFEQDYVVIGYVKVG